MYAILDIETTGGKYNEEGITEIAIYKFDGEHLVDNFVSLVNPERPIQQFVVQLTGITEKMVARAPKFYQLAKRIIEITEDCVLVAHNASFDYRMLRLEFDRLGYKFERNTLCTVELSKTLIPDAESYKLSKLTKSLGIPLANAHRAEADTVATLQLFKILLQKDVDKTIIKSAVKSESKKQLVPKLQGFIDKMPYENGLFYLHNEEGNILYIGKAKNLKKDVRNLFLRTSKKMKRLQHLTVDVSFERTGNALVSYLKFVQEINAHKPSFNKRSTLKVNDVQFSNPNMILIDKGRDAGEKSVILIQENAVQGYGFVDLAYQINNAEVLANLLSPLDDSEENKTIINQHLEKRKVQKIIRF